ncbi:MAG: O-antigen ligase family protein, partial [Patescibacteria group bacterium]
VSYIIFGSKEVYLGGLYLFRIFAYVSFFILAWNLSKRNGFSKIIFNSAFLLVIALTYSRAGYLALIGGSFVIFFLIIKNLKRFLLFTFFFLLIIVFLPRRGGEGVKLERTASVILRIEDYQDTLTIFKKSPLFGVGYNNMCFAREKYLGEINLDSHACSGSASSLLLVLATTGIVGFLMFLVLIYKLIPNLDKNIYGFVFLSCLVALLIHSLFVNSLFYPWVMGWMGLLLAISLKSSKE